MTAHSPTNHPQPGGTPKTKPRRFLVLLIGFALVIGAMALFHAPLLRLAASGFVQQDPLPNGEYGALLFGFPQWSKSYDTVRELIGPKGVVVLVKGKQTRLMRLGLEKPWWETDIVQLNKRGITNLDFLDAPEARYSYQCVPFIANWLEEHPNQTLLVCHGRFYGLTLSRILARHLTTAQFQRLAMIPIDDPDYDPPFWWKKKEGQGAIISAFSGLAFDLILGDGVAPGPDRDPKAYEESLP